jgi:hypothetical protein
VTALSAFAAASISATRSLADFGVQQQNMALRTGLTIKEVGAFSFAAKATGTDVEALQSSMRKLSQGLAEGGTDGKKAAEGLRDLGVVTRTSSGETRSSADIFEQVSASINRLGITAETRTAMLKAFGRNALELIPMFVSLNGNVARFNELGLGVSEGEMAKFKAFQVQVTGVDAAWEQAKRHISEGIAGSIWLDVKGSGAALLEILAGNHPHAAKATASQTNELRSQQGLPPLPGDVTGSRIGSLLQSMAGQADISMGTQLSKNFASSRLGTPEGIEERVKGLEEKNANLQAALQGGGIGASFATTTISGINKNQREIDSLKDWRKNLETTHSLYEGIGKRVSEAEGASLGPASKVYAELDSEVSKGANRNRRGAGGVTLQSSYDILASHALDSEMDSMREADARGALRFSGAVGDVYGGALFRGQRPHISLADQGRHSAPDAPEEQSEESKRQVGIVLSNLRDHNSLLDEMTKKSGEEGLASIGRNSDFQARTLAVSPGLDQAEKIAALHRIDLSTAQLRYDKELETAGLLSLEKDRVEATHKAELDNEIELQRVKEENLLRIADLEAQKLEAYKSAVGGLYDALTSRTPNAIPQFLKSQAMDLGRTITQNLAAEGFKTIENLTPHAQSGTLLGRALNNTPFGPNPLQSATDLNTAATIANTLAIERMTGIGGGSGSLPGMPDSGLGIGGIPASWTSLPSFGGGTASPKSLSALGSLFGNFGAGASSVLSGNALSILTGNNTTGPTGLSAQIGAGAGIAGALGVGGYGIYSGLKQGGVGGDLKAAGSAAGVAAGIVSNVSKLLDVASPLLSAIPVVGSIAALALPLLGGLFNNPQKRENEINKELSANQYMAPTALNLTQDSSGHYTDFDARGGIRSSTFSPYPIDTNPFTWEQTHGLFGGPPTFYDVPGGTQQPFSPAPAPAAPIYVTIHANDAASFADMLSRNPHAVADATASHLQNVNGRLTDAIQFVTNTGRHS